MARVGVGLVVVVSILIVPPEFVVIRLVTDDKIFHIVAISAVPSRIIKFTLAALQHCHFIINR